MYLVDFDWYHSCFCLDLPAIVWRVSKIKMLERIGGRRGQLDQFASTEWPHLWMSTEHEHHQDSASSQQTSIQDQAFHWGIAPPRAVERLLGMPEYCPTDCHWASSHDKHGPPSRWDVNTAHPPPQRAPDCPIRRSLPVHIPPLRSGDRSQRWRSTSPSSTHLPDRRSDKRKPQQPLAAMPSTVCWAPNRRP